MNFLDTTVFKGERFYKESVLDVRTHFKAPETFLYMHFSSCHAPGVAKGFIKGEALRLLRTNSSKPLYANEVTQATKSKRYSLESNLPREDQRSRKKKKCEKTYCFLSRNTIHHAELQKNHEQMASHWAATLAAYRLRAVGFCSRKSYERQEKPKICK